MAVTVLGIYVADLVLFGQKIPQAGETVLGNNFVVGPGGKGSNQAVAASKAGVKTHFISKIGDDQFGRMAIEMYDEAKVDYSNVSISEDYSTGAAAIMVDEVTGANAINVYPGASGLTNSSLIRNYLIIPLWYRPIVLWTESFPRNANATTQSL